MWKDLMDASLKQKTKVQNKNAIFVVGGKCLLMHELSTKRSKKWNCIPVRLRKRIWETEGRMWRWERFFIVYFFKLFGFWSHLQAIWFHAHTKKAFLRRTKWKKSPERKVSMLWCLNIFHMRRTAIKFSLSREWAEGEEKIGAPRGRTPGGWRERRSHAVSGHLSGPSLGSYGEVMW